MPIPRMPILTGATLTTVHDRRAAPVMDAT